MSNTKKSSVRKILTGIALGALAGGVAATIIVAVKDYSEKITKKMKGGKHEQA